MRRPAFTMVLPCFALLMGAAVLTSTACGDSESEDGTSAGGSGGAAGPACDTNADCAAGTCDSGEAATTSCVDGSCETACDAAFTECAECSAPADCMFDGDMCSPPRTDPFQNCFEGKCSEICNAATEQSCLTDTDCPKVQCPGNAAAVAQCIGGGCLDAATRCCS